MDGSGQKFALRGGTVRVLQGTLNLDNTRSGAFTAQSTSTGGVMQVPAGGRGDPQSQRDGRRRLG